MLFGLSDTSDRGLEGVRICRDPTDDFAGHGHALEQLVGGIAAAYIRPDLDLTHSQTGRRGLERILDASAFGRAVDLCRLPEYLPAAGLTIELDSPLDAVEGSRLAPCA